MLFNDSSGLNKYFEAFMQELSNSCITSSEKFMDGHLSFLHNSL